MKTLLVLLVFSMFCMSAFAGVKTFYKTGTENYRVYHSFELDAFSELDNYTYCFTGNAHNVCSEVSRGELKLDSHGYYQVLNCEIQDKGLVETKVNVRTDYGDNDDLVYLIPRCTIEQLIE